MAAIVGMRVWVDLGNPPRKPYGLLEFPGVLQNTDDRVAVAGAESQTHFCDAAPELGEGYCGPAVPRVFRGIDDVMGDPFTLSDSVECGLAGEVRIDEATEGLAYKESHGVELQVGALMDANGTDLGTGDAATVVASLESWLGDTYAGRGLIHVNVGTATLLYAARVLVGEGASLATVAGTPVVVGSGYTPGTLYASGQVTVLRGTTRMMTSPVGLSSAGADNSALATAEATYVPLIECGSAWGVLV